MGPGRSTYDCDVCSAAFLCRDSLIKHTVLVHFRHRLSLKSREELVCDDCGHGVSSARRELFFKHCLAKHVGAKGRALLYGVSEAKPTHRRYLLPLATCDDCHLRVSSPPVIRRHWLREHSFRDSLYIAIRRKERKAEQKARRVTACDDCGSRVIQMAQHLGRCPMRQSSAEEEKVDERGRRRYGCDACDKSYVETTGLKQHLATVHQGRPALRRSRAVLRCDDCDKTLKRNVFFYHHKQSHGVL